MYLTDMPTVSFTLLQKNWNWTYVKNYQKFYLIPNEMKACEYTSAGLAFDNYDHNVETFSGKNTLHEILGIDYQLRNDSEGGNEDENENPEETVIQKGKRRCRYEARNLDVNHTEKNQKWLILKWFHSLMKEDWLYQNHIQNLDMMMLNGWFLLHFQERLNRCGLDGIARNNVISSEKHKKPFTYHRSISHQLRQLLLLKLWKEHWNSLTTLKKKLLQLGMILLLQKLLCRYKPRKHQHMIKCLLYREFSILSCLYSVL